MDSVSWVSVLPAVIAIGTALITKQVMISLFAGIWLGCTILGGWNPILGIRDALEAMVAVFADRGNVLILIFSALIGSFVALTQRSGGVLGFVDWIVERGYVRTARGARVLPTLIGLGLFLESNLTCLVSGAVARPLFDRFRLPREKLAYLCDATAAPVCVLFPLNAYGAVILGILGSQGVEAPMTLFLTSIPFNFYCLITIGLALVIAISGRDWGPMARAETRARETGQLVAAGATPLVSDDVMSLTPMEGVLPRARNMIVPTASLLAMVAGGLILTDGDASTAIFWGMSFAVFVASAMYVGQKIFTVQEAIDTTMRGIGGLIPVIVLIVLAFALGSVSRELHAGEFLAGLASDFLHPIWLPALLFLIAGIASFSTGTSWGTFAIVLPIGLSVGTTLGLDPRLMVGAVVGGSIFGDHCSPISDTTIVASLAAGSDHIDHVNTQLPYALVTGLATVILLVAAAALSS